MTSKREARSNPGNLGSDMKSVTLCIPDTIEFSDLRLQRENDGSVSFEWTTIEAICSASGLDCAVFRDSPEDNLAALINTWYEHHIADGGDPDPVQEDLIAEALAEEMLGGGLSYQPGSA